MTLLKACGRWGHVFATSASPINMPCTTKKLAIMPPSSTVHGGQYDTKYVTFGQLLHAAFMANKIWVDNLEPPPI